MKKIFFILLLYSINSISQSPLVTMTLGTKYREAEITFVDEHTEKGYIYGFIDNKAIEFDFNFLSEFSSIETRLNLTDESFDFKKSLEEKPIKLKSKDIVEIRLTNYDGKLEYWKLMDLKTVNSKGEIIDLHKKAWLPILKMGKVNLFSINIISRNKYAYTISYLNNSNDNFAINPINLSLLDVFSLGKINNKMIFALKDVFKDCPEFLKQLEGDEKTVLERYFKNGKEIKEDKKELKEKSENLSRDERKQLEMVN
jgi:hypothetical protein